MTKIVWRTLSFDEKLGLLVQEAQMTKAEAEEFMHQLESVTMDPRHNHLNELLDEPK